MIFNEKVINDKKIYMDDILQNKNALIEYLNNKISGNYSLFELERPWKIGGGASLFRIKGDNIDAFLKVKRRDLYVESKLEEEKDFINESSLYHEYIMMKKASAIGVCVPDIIFYGHDDTYDYLAMKYIESSLLDELKKIDIQESIALFNDIKDNVRKLYDNNIVHTDIHEYNIRCNNGHAVLIDFEECRFIEQNECFEKSLDYIGHNKYSNVGLYPYFDEEDYMCPYTCIERLKEVFKKELVNKIVNFLPKCNYDSSNGICNALDHGRSDKIYQSINNKYLAVGGQRNNDDRIQYVEAVCRWALNGDRGNFIDVGSNNGLFCRDVAKCMNGIQSIGLEGTHNFNVLAEGIAFLEDVENVRYYDFICGEDSLKLLNIKGRNVVSICSVWHHIVNKDLFLEEIKGLDIAAVILEFAIQPELYKDWNWRSELERIKKTLGFNGEYFIAYSSDYERPMVVITKEKENEKKLNALNAIIEKSVMLKSEDDEFDKGTFSKMFADYISRNRKCSDNVMYTVCYGAGKYGKRIVDFIGAQNIVFFIDNNKEKTGFSEHMVITEKDAIKYIDDDTQVIISMYGEVSKKIKNRLLSIGIKNVKTFDEMLSKGYIKSLRHA